MKKKGIRVFMDAFFYDTNPGSGLSVLSPICPTLSDELQRVDNQTLIFPPEKLIAHLSFSHIAELLPIADPLKRLFYETEAIKRNWSVRELRRQIATQLYERCGMSFNPNSSPNSYSVK